MNKLNLFLISAICLLLGYSCKSKTDATLTNMIPKESTFVGYFNTMQMAEEADYDPFKNPTVMQGINFAKVMFRNQDAIKAIDEMTKDVNSIGVNLKGDIFVFADGNTFGAILTVNDAAVLKNNIINLSGIEANSIREHNNVYSYTAGHNVMSACWDDSKLLVLFNGMDIASGQTNTIDIGERALNLFAQGTTKSINSNPEFATFMKNLSDISFYSSLEFLKNINGSLEGADLPSNLPKDILEGVVNIFNISFDKGYIALNTNVLFENSATEAKYKEIQSQLTSVINKSELPFIPEDAVMAMTASLNGSELFRKLDTWGVLQPIKDEMSHTRFDVLQSVVEDTKGTITFVLRGFAESKSEDDGDYYLPPFIPLFTLYSQQVPGTNILNTLKEIFKDEDMTEINNETIKIKKEGLTFYAGLKENQFFTTNDEEAYKRISTGNNTYNNYYINLKNNSTSIFQGEFKGVEDLIKDIPFGNKPNEILMSAYAKYFINLFSGYYFEQDTNFAGQGRLNLNNQQKNSLNIIMHEIEKGMDNLR